MSEKVFWIAEHDGYQCYAFDNRDAAMLWLRWEHDRQSLDAVRMNEGERRDREEKIARIQAGDWEPSDPESMLAHLRDPLTLHLWEVSEIDWQDYISRFTYNHDEHRIRRVETISEWPKPTESD